MMYSLMMMVILGSVNAAEVKSEGGLQKAVALLEKTEIGKSVLDQAREKNLVINEGKVSKTEIIATRIMKGKVEKLDFNVQVLIAKEKSPVFQAIDLAHELVHALNPKSNPFDPKLNAADYIREGIESEGGEAHAIMQECKVGQELLTLVDEDSAQLIKARCQFVWKTENNEALWKLSFYHLGKQIHQFINKLNSVNADDEKTIAISKMVQSKDPMFTSAAANKPYPLALLDEYVEITKKICNRTTDRKVASVQNAEMEERCQSLSSAQFNH